MSKKHIILGLSLLVLLGLAVYWGSTNPVQEADRVTLRLGYRPSALADITPIIIKESGIGVTPAIVIELIPLASPQVALQKFDAGELDAIAGLTMEAILQRLSTRTDLGFYAYYVQVDKAGEGWVSVVANSKSGVSQLTDLAGKTVASLPTEQAQYLIKAILKRAGLADSSIRIVTYNPATPLLGLEAGEHDALFGLEPAMSRAIAAGHKRVAAGPVSEYLFAGESVPLSASIVSTTFAQQHPHAVEQLVEIVDQALAIQARDPALVRSYFSKPEYGQLEQQVANLLALPNMQKPSDSVRAVLRRFAAELSANGVLKYNVNSDALFR